MPVSPSTGAQLAWRLNDLILESETYIARLIADRLKRGINSPEWAREKLAELSQVRAEIQAELDRMNTRIAGEVEATLLEAYQAGQGTATAELARLGWNSALPPAISSALATIAQDTLARITGITPRALRASVDAYQQAVASGSSMILTGAMTRVEATQQVVNTLLAKGIKGFTDAAGRQWSLDTYAEMALRTGAGNAALLGHMDNLAVAGIDLIQTVPGPYPCPTCQAWAGKILSRTGATTTFMDRGVQRTVDGTLADARAAGVFHPNCRDATGAYIPDVSDMAPPVTQPELYEPQQRQRGIERHIREWKRRQALALDDDQAARARARVRLWQEQMRQHLAQYPELRRRYDRERS